MDWHAFVRRHLADITGDAARDEDIVEELAQHLAQRVDELIARGVGADEARERAAGELRDHPQLVRLLREADAPRRVALPPPAMGHPRLLSGVWQDVRYAARMLRRAPSFSTAAVLTLGLGIGMSASIFAVVDTVLLRPVPFLDSERVVVVWGTDRRSGTTHEPSSFPDFLDFRERSRQLSSIAAVMAGDVTLTPATGEPVRLASLSVTDAFANTLGLRLVTGRFFTEAETQRAGPQVILISEQLWSRLYGRAPDVLGRTVRLDGVPRTIVGVLPASADFGILQVLRAADYARGFADRDARAAVEVWTPLQADATTLPRQTHPLHVLGRLAPGSTVSAAQEELSAIAADLELTYPVNTGHGARVESFNQVVFGPVRPALGALMGAAGFLLLLSCVNVANLLLTRGSARGREVAMRAALGANGSRLARQFAVENMLLTLISTAVGIALAKAVLSGFDSLMPVELPRISAVGIDLRLVALSVGVALVIGVTFGLLPVWQARRLDLNDSLGADSGRVVGGGRRLRSALVITEVALAVALTTGAGLLMNSFLRLREVDPGFSTSGVLKVQFQLPRARYPIDMSVWPPRFSDMRRFNASLVERVAALPGVQSAAIAVNHPLDPGSITRFMIVGREEESRDFPEIRVRIVTPGYFATLGIPLLRGQWLDASGEARPEMVINEVVAERFFAGRDPIGQEIGMFGSLWRVVGIVGHERLQGLAAPAPTAAYVSLSHIPSLGGSEALVVRTTGDPGTLASEVRAVIRSLDPELALFGVEPLANTLAESLSRERFLMLLVGLFASLALALSAIGIHGVLSYTVAQRTREIGIRMALGASGTSVLRHVMKEGGRITLAGLLAGSVLALLLSRALSGLLFGVSPTDPATFGIVLLVLGVVAGIAIWLPARRAIRIAPIDALRVD